MVSNLGVMTPFGDAMIKYGVTQSQGGRHGGHISPRFVHGAGVDAGCQLQAQCSLTCSPTHKASVAKWGGEAW